MAAAQQASASTPAVRPRPPAPSTLQLLSFVFASADLVLEVADDGAVTYASGAAGQLLGQATEALVGRPWLELVDPADADLAEAALMDLRPGQRRGPIRISLTSAGGAKPAMLSLFRIPHPDALTAAALSLCPPGLVELAVDATGLASREDFEAAAIALVREAERAGRPLHMDLLEFAGLVGALEAMEPARAEAARRKLAGLLRAASHGGLPAAALGPESFAMLRSGPPELEAIGARVREVAGPTVQVQASDIPLDAAAPGESLRAIRYALDRCIEEGPQAASVSFEAALRQTVAEFQRFKDLLQSGRFELVYQPVLDLKTRALHHYEALARFGGGGGPAATIRLAEELGLIVEFDLAIIRGVAEALRRAPVEVCVAANVSAYSMQQPDFVGALLKATELMPKLRPRLLIELTETHRLLDLEAANEMIQRLRAAGHVVCLDDFGAGAASLDYLRRLETDVVKFDGRFVRSIEERPRDAILLRRIAELCRELGVRTVAEMIETEETARLAADLGVDLGQGWLFGRPVSQPVKLDPPKPLPARRVGAVETWS